MAIKREGATNEIPAGFELWRLLLPLDSKNDVEAVCSINRAPMTWRRIGDRAGADILISADTSIGEEQKTAIIKELKLSYEVRTGRKLPSK